MQTNEDFICKCWVFSAALWLGVFADSFSCCGLHVASSSLGTFFQYIRASHRFISCLLCSFILVRYSVCHYQKHTACLIYFFGEDQLFVLTPVNLFGQPNLGLRESIVQWNAHFSKWIVQLSAVDMDWVSSPFAMTSGGIFSVYFPLCFKNTCTIFLLSL